MNTALITSRPIARPQYAQAETFDAWLQINAEIVNNYWRDCAWVSGEDPDRLAYAELFDFAKTQFDLATSASSPDGQHGRKSALSGAQHELSGEERPTAGIGTADAGPSYPVTCRARYYDAASRILEDELGLNTHDNCDELGQVIQRWIEETRNNEGL